MVIIHHGASESPDHNLELTMDTTLEDLALGLNTTVTQEGTSFDAVVSDNDVMEVICSNNDEFPIHIAITDTQILSVTPLFHVKEVQQDKLPELDKLLLRLSPAIPLSSIGLQEANYILFGSMALNTSFENIVHELEVQAENTVDVLEAVEDLLI